MGSERNIAMLVLTVGIAVFLFGSCVSAQNCGCSSNLCCGKYGYCGTGNDYCGTGCKEGPCYTGTTPSPSTGSGTAVSSVISKDFFDAILSVADGSCAGKNFYTYDGFIQATNAYSGFGTTGTSDDSKRDLAAFFAHVPHETGCKSLMSISINVNSFYW